MRDRVLAAKFIPPQTKPKSLAVERVVHDVGDQTAEKSERHKVEGQFSILV